MQFKSKLSDSQGRTSPRNKLPILPYLRCQSRIDNTDTEEFFIKSIKKQTQQQTEEVYKMGTDLLQFGFKRFCPRKIHLPLPNHKFPPEFTKQPIPIDPTIALQRKSKLSIISDRQLVKKSSRQSNYDIDFRLTEVLTSHLISRHNHNRTIPPNFQVQLSPSQKKIPYNIRDSFLNYQISQAAKSDQLCQVEESINSSNSSMTSVDLMDSSKFNNTSKICQPIRKNSISEVSFPKDNLFRESSGLIQKIEGFEKILLDEYSPQNKAKHSSRIIKTTR